jgi:hypothetical protein
MAIHTKQVKVKGLSPKKDKKEQEQKEIRDKIKQQKFEKKYGKMFEKIFAPYNPNNVFGLKEHQIVSCPGKNGELEYGVIVNVDEYTVRWDTDKPSDFEYGVCVLPHNLVDKYEFKYINQDGTYPKIK